MYKRTQAMMSNAAKDFNILTISVLCNYINPIKPSLKTI